MPDQRGPDHAGKLQRCYWGKINVAHLPAVHPETLELDERKAATIRRITRKKIQKDVENSRWKRFPKQEEEQFWRVGGRLFWETLRLAKHGSKPRTDEEGYYIPQHLDWMFKDERSIEIDGEKYVPVDPWQCLPLPYDYVRKDIRQLPKRCQPWNKDGVRVMCDASAFVQRIKRASTPAMSFRELSRSS